VATTNDLANRLSPSTLRKAAVALMATGVAVDVLVMQRVHMRAMLLERRMAVWRRLDRPGGALVVAGIALLRMSSRPRP
jgi:hypothetical protein